MVYVHGGGWRKGDKQAVGEKVEFFCGNDWLLLSINYRLLPDGKHPANVRDVAGALAWVHDNIAKHGGDPNRIFLMGHSAGAHLVSLVATDQRHLKSVNKELSILKGVIPLDTNTYDIPKLMQGRSIGSYKIVFGEDPETWRDAAPISHVAAGKKIPPFLICYSRGLGNLTNPVRAEQANAFAKRLTESDVSAEVVDASDRNHGEINSRLGKSDDQKVTGKAKAFVESILEDQAKAQSQNNRPQSSTDKS
jgi:acetyl esterase/lipase